jgi:hypothetical protein
VFEPLEIVYLKNADVYDPVGWLNITFEPEGADDVIKYVLRVLLKEYDEPVIVNDPEIV